MRDDHNSMKRSLLFNDLLLGCFSTAAHFHQVQTVFQAADIQCFGLAAAGCFDLLSSLAIGTEQFVDYFLFCHFVGMVIRSSLMAGLG